MSRRIEVVFTQNVESVAKRSEQRTVAGGYWRNFLRPRRLAVLTGTKEAKKLIAEKVVVTKSADVVEVPRKVKPSVREETKARRISRKHAKVRKERQKAARLRER